MSSETAELIAKGQRMQDDDRYAGWTCCWTPVTTTLHSWQTYSRR